MPAMKETRGRKPLPPGARRDARLSLAVKPSTLAEWKRKASKAGLTLTAWIERKLGEKR